jgi:hypothetical protein
MTARHRRKGSWYGHLHGKSDDPSLLARRSARPEPGRERAPRATSGGHRCVCPVHSPIGKRASLAEGQRVGSAHGWMECAFRLEGAIEVRAAAGCAV